MPTLIGTSFGAVVHATATNSTPVQGGGKGFSVGMRASDYNGKEYVYAQANSAVAQYDVVHIPSDTYVAAGLTTALSAASELIAVAPIAVASGEYAWFQIYGATKVSVAGSCLKAVTLYSTTTAGRVDDATASNYEIRGIQILSTNPSATATTMSAFLAWPKVRILPGVL